MADCSLHHFALQSFEFDPIGPLERLIFEVGKSFSLMANADSRLVLQNTPGVKRSVLRLSDAARFEALCAVSKAAASSSRGSSSPVTATDDLLLSTAIWLCRFGGPPRADLLRGRAVQYVIRARICFLALMKPFLAATFDWTFLDGHRPSDEHELPAVANPSKSGDAHDPEQLASDSTEPMPLGSEFKDAQPTSINDRSSAASLTPPVSASARSLNATLGGREGLSSKNGEATK